MATLLDLHDTPFDGVQSALDAFFAHNAFQWDYYEDRIYLDASNPRFLEILKQVEDAIMRYNGKIRGALHIYVMNVGGLSFEPLCDFFWKVIQNEYYFGSDNLQVYAKHTTGGQAESINSWAISLQERGMQGV